MTPEISAQVFDARALTKFSVTAVAACVAFDLAYSLVFWMMSAIPLEIAALLLRTYLLGWWGREFRYTMKTAGLILSVVLPNLAMGLLVVILMALQAATGRP